MRYDVEPLWNWLADWSAGTYELNRALGIATGLTAESTRGSQKQQGRDWAVGTIAMGTYLGADMADIIKAIKPGRDHSQPIPSLPIGSMNFVARTVNRPPPYNNLITPVSAHYPDSLCFCLVELEDTPRPQWANVYGFASGAALLNAPIIYSTKPFHRLDRDDLAKA